MADSETIEKYRQMRREEKALITKRMELESDREEHRIVLETLSGLDEERRCYRILGGVLIERKVKDIIPFLLSTEERLSYTINSVLEKEEEKRQELIAFAAEHNIRSVPLNMPISEVAPSNRA
uniref:Prefoldin subunit 2 n=1 Tax=Trichuris muris TaxID=70415 RepID=A0A5S6QM34_TRIMR